jgi:hypothetical protein
MSANYTTETYLQWADHLESLTKNECHPALFSNKNRVAEVLRQASALPADPQNRQVLNGVKFLSRRDLPALSGG